MDSTSNLAQEVKDLKRRMDDAERGVFSGFTKQLIDDFLQVKQDVKLLMDAYRLEEKKDKKSYSRREKILFAVAVGGLLLAVFNRLDLLFG